MKRIMRSFTIILFIFLIGSQNRPLASAESLFEQAPKDNSYVYIPLIYKPCTQDYQKTVPFYHLRLVIEMNSTHASLIFTGTPDILTMRKIGEINLDSSTLIVSSPSGDYNITMDTNPANNAFFTADIALSPDAPGNLITVSFSSSEATARFYLIDNSGQTLIQEVSTNSSTTFNVDMSSLTGVPPSDGQVMVPCHKQVWAIYYGWYDDDVPWMDWDDPRWIDRPQVLYNSEDPVAIARQIDQAISAGINGFLCEWLGPDDVSDTDENFQTMLEIAYQKGFASAAFVDFSDLGYSNVTEDDIVNWLSYIIIEYGNHPAYAKVNGKPLIVIYATGTFSMQTWRNVFARLEQQGLEATYWEDGYGNLDHMEDFDGAQIYISSLDLTPTYLTFGSAMYYLPLLQESAEWKIWAASVFPGFDNGTIIIDRNDGQLYRKNFRDAMQSTAPWVFITSWNEYQETTQIEPSELYADQYLQITRELFAFNYYLYP